MKPFRFQRLCEAMQQADADVLIASSLENVYYTSGFYSTSKKMTAATKLFSVVLPGEAQPWLILPVCDLPSAYEAGLDMDFAIPYGAFYFTFHQKGNALCSAVTRAMERTVRSGPIDALCMLVKKLCPAGGKIALDFGGLDGSCLTSIGKAIPGYRIFNGIPAFWQARKIKHAEELAALKTAAKIAENAVLHTFHSLKEGMSEKDAVTIYTHEIMKQGADPTFAVFTFGDRAAFVDTSAMGGQFLKKGDMIRADVGCGVSGYQADMSRTAVLGRPEGHIADTFHAMREGQLSAIEKVAPGVPFATIYKTAMDNVHKAGIPGYQRVHCGHCIGLSISEPPHIRPDSDAFLEENMVLCIETPYYELGWGGVQVEDTLAVTQTGYELFTTTPSSLVIL